MRGLNVSNTGSLLPMTGARVESRFERNESGFGVDLLGPLDYRQTGSSSGFGTLVTQGGENFMKNQERERKHVLSPACVQKASSSGSLSADGAGSGGRLETGKGVGDFWIKEYAIDLGQTKGDEGSFAPSTDQDQEWSAGASLIANIPLSLCVSYFRQERSRVCRRIHSVWRGYKTRSILRGSLSGLESGDSGGADGDYPSSRVHLSYKIHKILLSILDLYDLILDEEESKTGATTAEGCGRAGAAGSNATIVSNSPWLDAMYEQVVDFKEKYISEVNSALHGDNGRKWVLDIIRAREASGRDMPRRPRERRGLLPMRFEVKYLARTQRSSGLAGKVERTASRSNNHLGDPKCSGYRQSLGKSLEDCGGTAGAFASAVFLPYSLVKSNSVEEVSSYLGVRTDQLIGVIQNEPASGRRSFHPAGSGSGCYSGARSRPGLGGSEFELTPGFGGRLDGGASGEYTQFLGEQTPDLLRGAKHVYFTPESFVHVSVDAGTEGGAMWGEEHECGEYHTPIQEELGRLGEGLSGYRSDSIENQGVGQKFTNRTKPRPYLKRKSKSVLPPKEAGIELGKVTSKIRELYKGRHPIGEKMSRDVPPASGGRELSGSRIPSVSSSLSIISDSPMRNSSSKVSRIPRYATGGCSASKSSQSSRGQGTPQVIRARYSDV